MFHNISTSHSISGLKRQYSSIMTINDGEKMSKLKPFILANIVTHIYMNSMNQIKIPYSAAFIKIRPNQPINFLEDNFYSTEEPPLMVGKPISKELPFHSSINSPTTNILTERGLQLVYSLLSCITRVVKNEKRSLNLYLTNNRDDGYLILRNSLIHPYNHNLKCSPVTRYNNISNMRVYSSLNNRLLFKVRHINDILCSIRVDELNKLFCQQHCSCACNTHMISTSNQSDYHKYMMIHDIMLHAAIMQKAQEHHWRNFQIDVIYKQNIAEKVKKTPNLWIANIYKTFTCSSRRVLTSE